MHVVVNNTLTGEQHVTSETILPPSHSSAGANLSIQFGAESRAAGIPDPEDVKVPLKRNEISVVRYVWDDATGGFKIFVLVTAALQEYFELELE